MNSGRTSAAGLAAIVLTTFTLAGSQEDLELQGEGVGTRLSALRDVTHLMITGAEDCPTCYEFLIAEITRISLEPYWAGRWIIVVASAGDTTGSFARWIRRRYAPPVRVYSAEWNAVDRALPLGLPGTPCIVTRNGDGTPAGPWVISSSRLGQAAVYFDSLYGVATGRGRP